MCPLNYRPEDKSDDEGGDYPPLNPGRYEFKVDDAEETTFKSGNEGLKVKLLVGYTNGRDVPCFCNLVYTKNMLWKLEDFLDSLGLDFENPPDAWELKGKTGAANFVVNDRGYFEVKSFAMPDAPKANGAQKLPPGAAKTEEPLPF